MRIVYLSSSSIPSPSANSIHVIRMCQAFGRHGHRLRLIAQHPHLLENKLPAPSYYGDDFNFDLQLLKWHDFYGSSVFFALHSLYLTILWKPDLVIGRNLTACLFACLTGFPTIFESHAPIKHEGKLQSLLFTLLSKLPSFLGLVVITQALADHYLSRTSNLLNKILVAPDGADLIPPGTTPLVLNSTRNRLQVGYIGNLYPGKCMEILIPLCLRCPWADFHIVGGSTQQLLSWFVTQPIPTNLIHHLHKPPKLIPRYMLAMVVLLLPNQQYVEPLGGGHDIGPWTSPLKAFEYMASARPIVCSDLPVLREFAVHYHNAILCPPDKLDHWVNALITLSKYPKLRSSLGNAALSDLKLYYTWSQRTSRILRHFKT